MADGIQFDLIYSPKLLVMTDGRHRSDLDNQIYNQEIVRLWRYDLIRTGSVRENCFWSELETDYPHLAGEATGIGDYQCVWRAEWNFHIDDAYNRVRVGYLRFSRCGVFREYMNIHAVREEDLVWNQMRPI